MTTNIINLADFRKRAAAPTAVEKTSVDGERVEFTGTPDEIYKRFVAWLSNDFDIIGVITVRRGGCLVVEDETDVWRDRDDDEEEIWAQSFPMFDDTDIHGRSIPFKSARLLSLISEHQEAFKALLASDEQDGNLAAQPFMIAFYQY